MPPDLLPDRVVRINHRPILLHIHHGLLVIADILIRVLGEHDLVFLLLVSDLEGSCVFGGALDLNVFNLSHRLALLVKETPSQMFPVHGGM